MIRHILVTAVLLGLVACATTGQVTETYRATDLAGIRFEQILVVGIASKSSSRRRFEDALVAQLGERAIASRREIERTDDISRESVVAAAARTGADAVLVTRLKDAQTRAKSRGGRTDVQARRKDERLVDFFRYDYVDYTDPESLTLLTTAVITTDLYRVSDEARVYAFESSAADAKTIEELVDALSRTVASSVRRSGLLP